MKLLFVSWDGPGTSYLESLFLPILARAKAPDDEITVIQFTWASIERSERNRRLAATLGLGYEAYEIAGNNDVLRVGGALIGGLRRLISIVRSQRIDVVLARSIIPAALVLVLRSLLAHRRLRFIYDADGLAADERLEFGGWTKWGLRHRLVRAVEAAAVRSASVVLVRSQHAKLIIHERTHCDMQKLSLVVNGRNADDFASTAHERASARQTLGIADDAVVVMHQGSFGPQYMPDLIFQTFAALERILPHRAHCFVVSPSQNHEAIESLRRRYDIGRITVLEASPSEMPKLLICADAGLTYRSRTLSQRAVAPIKVSEFLLAGVPVAYTAETGDLDDLLAPGVSIRISGSGGDSVEVADWITDYVMPQREDIRHSCEQLGHEQFSIEHGVRSYELAFNDALNT